MPQYPNKPEFANRLARQYKLSPQLAKYLALLVCCHIVTPQITYENMGAVDYRGLVSTLRRRLGAEGVKIDGQRCVGYWIEDRQREQIFQINNGKDAAGAGAGA